MTPPDRIARKLHGLIEPLHSFSYFAPESRAAYEEAGLKGFAQCYVAGRAAPMGAVGPEASGVGAVEALVVHTVWQPAVPAFPLPIHVPRPFEG